MTEIAQKRTNIVGFLSVVLLSAATMLWLLWHYPVSTSVATLVVLAMLGISARLARLIDTDTLSAISLDKNC